jgi:hypothetical protein
MALLGWEGALKHYYIINLLNATNLWLGLGFDSRPTTCASTCSKHHHTNTKRHWSCQVPKQHLVKCKSNTWSSDSIGQVQPFACKLLSLSCFCLLVHASHCVSGAAADYSFIHPSIHSFMLHL